MSLLYKRIALIVAIVITLLAGLLMFLYGINVRYTTDNAQMTIECFDKYYEKAETVDEKLEAYVKFNENEYNPVPVFTEDVKNSEGEVLCNIKMYQGILKDKRDTDGDGELEENSYLQYLYFISNIQYDKILDYLGIAEKDKENTTITFSTRSLNVAAVTDEDYESADYLLYSSSTIALSKETNYLSVVDEKSNRYEENSEDEDYVDPYYQVGKIEITSTKASSFKLAVIFTPNVEDTEAEYSAKKEIFEISEPTTIDRLASTDGFEAGYNKDILNIGYRGYVIGRQIWWQVLITVVIAGIISFSFYFALTMDEEKGKKAKKNKK